ncbi:CBS domain-containing protein [Marinicella sp. S1101]|uniref:CBS domain-containing protein n=1 Tax=Marinicella marina TaxID=2996016 RepID=UPI002260EA4F|nr:CBS domain-containing protein [Marinicella marina]MCX7553553.1 CBS domain-containing protein [Marinicella marina]MDJ1140177.1 CBS domain-containing protein [Marinicella marina]
MGEQNISRGGDNETKRLFTRAVLNDLKALELMIEKGLIESGARRIGAEQEMFITDNDYSPNLTALDLLNDIGDERFTNEIALFNIEANLTPRRFKGKCLHEMEEEIKEVLSIAHKHANHHDSKIILAGILPTLRQMHLTMDSITPVDRYYELNDRLKEIRGSDFRLDIRGVDELSVTHDNFLLEAMNTSFQVHFQVSGNEFVNMYNMSQAVTAPLMAVAVNSGLIHHLRLWHESRIAVFQNSIDTRSTAHQNRGTQPRVHFGNEWIESIVDVFRDDISRFSVVLTSDFEEDPVGMVNAGLMPKLKALMLHNGTVYRWNRPCYGVKDNIPHLRIENRVLPSGPSVIDEVANSAFYFGLMSGMGDKVKDITEVLRFSHARNNFLQACRTGLECHFTWINGESISATDLIKNELLPIAEAGLKSSGIDKDDIEHYLTTIEQRVDSKQTGAKWAIKSITEMNKDLHPDEKVRAIVAEMHDQQAIDTPIHEWPLAQAEHRTDWRAGYLLVGQFMVTKLLTVRPDDSMDLAASIMDWKRVRHVPVENDEGELVGLVSNRSIIKKIVDGDDYKHGTAIREIMNDNPIFAEPKTTTVEAIQIMREKRISCLPVVENGKLVGVITEYDLIKIASHVLEADLKAYKKKQID